MVLILTDADVARSCTASRAIAVTRRALSAHGEGRLSAPARAYNDIAPGRLVYTAGALEGLVHGVRIYDHVDSEQVVAVWDSESRRLAAVVLGAELGRRRTGAIGAVAIDALAKPDANTLGVIGTGHQAWAQVWAATAVRDWSHIKVYSRNPYWRECFAARCREQLLVDAVAVDSARRAFRHRDAVIVATNSSTPVFDSAWLEPGMHVTSVGPKTLSAHEIPLDLLDRVHLVVTDSLAQVHGNPQPHALSTRSMVELGKVLVGAAGGRTDDDQVTMFCSVGLAGTEVILAADLAGLPTVLPPRLAVEAPPRASALSEGVSTTPDEDEASPNGAGPRLTIPAQPQVAPDAAADSMDSSVSVEGARPDILPSQSEPPGAETTTADGIGSTAASPVDDKTAEAEKAAAGPDEAAGRAGPTEADSETREAEGRGETPGSEQDETEPPGEETFPPALAAMMGEDDEYHEPQPDAVAEQGAALSDAPDHEAAATDGEPGTDESATGEHDEVPGGSVAGEETKTGAAEPVRADNADAEPTDSGTTLDEAGAAKSADEPVGADSPAGESPEAAESGPSLTADDDAIAALKEAAARVVQPQGKKARPRTRR